MFESHCQRLLQSLDAAHAFPNLVPPVDREYTLKFLFGSGNIANGIDREWKKFRAILQEFFYPVVRSEPFESRARDWLGKPDIFKWDTSPLTIADNLVIGLMKAERAEQEGLR